MPTLRPARARRLDAAQSDPHGPLDPLPRRHAPGPEPTHADLLCAARVGRPHPERGNLGRVGVGYPGTPGIWSAEQVAGWKQVTSAVHEAGGRMLLQLWHVGRISDSSFLDNAPPVAPSAIAAKGNVSLLRPVRPYPVPRALEAKEIPGIVRAFRRGAENAQAAGFDGVEIHGANGYLLDQFLHDGSNHPPDRRLWRLHRESRAAQDGGRRCHDFRLGRRSGRHASGPAQRLP